MFAFQLFALGADFDPDAYVASTPLKFDGIWHKGESGHDHPKSSGVFKLLGDGQKVSLSEQEKIAIEYLSANREALKALARYPGVTTFILALQYRAFEFEPETSGFCIGPSTSLMRHCLDIGVSPNFYVSLDRKWESEQDTEPGAAAGGGL